ncbi:unnamed protein product [Adineta steineri]|uniref:Uncharacterized protein n=3 Tax=Adineta steineri TaxID=433720 RepID=A0A819K735_9BILA|nr:unnamed protein product [Adineta steineri]
MLRNQQNQQQLIPLKRVNIAATIRSFAADVTIYSFIARIDDREITAQLKEKKTAHKEYNEALQAGHGAYLLEQDENSQDNFVINVGALPPSKECEIVISYVTELNLVENGTKIRFVIPTTIAPRYNPGIGGISSPASTTSKYVQSAPYTIDFCCQVEKVGIASVSSVSHPIRMDLNMELIENRSNTIIVVETNAVMASFTSSEEDCQRVMNNTDITNEFIFVVDCSGSMDDENKIELARQAMLLFLKSLPVNCYFNIIRFGSDHQGLFSEITVIYNEANAQKAEQLTKTMRADLDGTELLPPLQWLDKNPPIQGHARQIFLLTDGEVSNVDEVVDLCRTMATSTRIFSFGLGSSPSRSLVKGLARATNGRFVFIPPHTSVDVHVGEQLQKALQPCITNVQVKWNLETTPIITIPMKTPLVYVNDRLIVYALADHSSIKFDHHSRVELTSAQHRLGEAKVTQIPNVSSNETIARLAAKALILELQHHKLPSSTQKTNTGSLQARFQEHHNDDETTKETTEKRIIELSLKYNILSPHTAFVGVEKRLNASNADMVLREVPIQISADDQHLLTHYQMYSNSYMLTPMFDTSQWCPDDLGVTLTNLRSQPLLDEECYYQLSPESASNKRLRDDDEVYEDNSCQLRIDNVPAQTTDISLMNDENIVRYLIDKQKFDGSWQLDENDIQRLTGKPMTTFQQIANNEVLISAIVISILEVRFASLSSMWHGIVQKARKHLLDCLGKDTNKLNTLLENIRQQFSHSFNEF